MGHRDLHGAEVGKCMCVEGDEWDIEIYMVQRWVSVRVWRGMSGT